MHKKITLFLLLFISIWKSNAQVNTIPFTPSMDTYQTISGTQVDMPNEDDVFHSNLPIGFNFVYNGNVTSKFGVCTNGFIVMDSLNHSGLWIMSSNSTNQLSVLMTDMQNTNAGGSIEYQTVGTAPNRVCIIQWNDYSIFGINYCHLNAQIRLYESSNCIQYTYGTNTLAGNMGEQFYVGLTGATSADYHLRSSSTSWLNTLSSTTYPGTGVLLNALNTIPSGLSYSFGICPAAGIPFSYITGNLYEDANGNGLKDVGEIGKPNVLLHESLQNYYAVTDANGDYSMLFTDSNLTYTVNAILPTYWNLTTTPVTYSITPLSQSTTNADFGMMATPNVHDVSIACNYTNLPWPNANVNFLATYHNNGTVVETGDSIFFTKDAHYSFVSSVPAPTSVNGNEIVWVYSNLLINEFRNITVHLHADTLITIGDTLHSSWHINPLASDAAPANNDVNITQACLSSFDPNFKSVSPEGNIVNTQELQYTIHFQNTGTFLAQNVFLYDTLNSNLDVSTFKLIANSHPVTYTINGAGNLRFQFANINLPDSNSNEPASHGAVTYSIMPKVGLAPASVIHNTASIVFDFNTAVVTNTTENIIISNMPNGWNEIVNAENPISVYPNPATQMITISAQENLSNAVISIYDLSGKLVLQKEIQSKNKKTNLDISSLGNGMYMIQVNNNNRLSRFKLMKK